MTWDNSNLDHLGYLEVKVLNGTETEAELAEYRVLRDEHEAWAREQPWFRRFQAAMDGLMVLARLRAERPLTAAEREREAELQHIVITGGGDSEGRIAAHRNYRRRRQ